MNPLNVDLHTIPVILKSPPHPGDEAARRFVCIAGFGCSAGPGGEKILGKFTSDNREALISSSEVEKLA